MPKEWKLCVRLKINRRMTVRVTDKKSNKSVIPGSIFAHVTKDYGTLEVHLRHFLLWRNMISDLIIHSFFSLFPFINECFLCFFLLSDASITDKCMKPICASTKFHSILHRRCCSLLFLLFRFEGGGMRLKKNNQYLHGVWTSSVSSSHRTLGTALLGRPRPRQATPTPTPTRRPYRWVETHFKYTREMHVHIKWKHKQIKLLVGITASTLHSSFGYWRTHRDPFSGHKNNSSAILKPVPPTTLPTCPGCSP